MSEHRIKSKSFALTYSQVDLTETKEKIAKRINKYYELLNRKIELILIGEELHKDEGKHFHVLLDIENEQDIRNTNTVFDKFCKHGNYKKCYEREGWLSYIVKHDPNPYIQGIFKEDVNKKRKNINENIIDNNLEKKPTKKKKISDEIKVMERIFNDNIFDTKKLRKEFPYYVYKNLSTIKQNILQAKQEKKEELIEKRFIPKKKWTLRLLPKDEESSEFKILDWSNNNLDVIRDFKQLQIWIHSDPGMGKTRFVDFSLFKYFNIYNAPNSNTFTSEFSEDKYDLIYFDEVEEGCGLTVSFLNGLLQGSQTGFHINQKYGGTIVDSNKPIIILSNFTPQQCWVNFNLIIIA